MKKLTKQNNANNIKSLVSITVPDWALSPLINSDFSALNDDEIERLNEFEADMIEQYGNANFMLPTGVNTEDEEGFKLGFLPYNDIDNLGSECYTVCLFDTKQF